MWHSYPMLFIVTHDQNDATLTFHKLKKKKKVWCRKQNKKIVLGINWLLN